MTASACPYCGSQSGIVHVHGHAQCATCGVNIEPCCDGADPGSEVSKAALEPIHADPQLFARMFERLGGARATVTADALVFALVEHLAVDLDTARMILDAGQHTGRLESGGSGCYRLASRPA